MVVVSYRTSKRRKTKKIKVVLPTGYPMCLSHFPLQRNHPPPFSFLWYLVPFLSILLPSWRPAYSHDHVLGRNTVHIAFCLLCCVLCMVVWWLVVWHLLGPSTCTALFFFFLDCSSPAHFTPLWFANKKRGRTRFDSQSYKKPLTSAALFLFCFLTSPPHTHTHKYTHTFFFVYLSLPFSSLLPTLHPQQRICLGTT